MNDHDQEDEITQSLPNEDAVSQSLKDSPHENEALEARARDFESKYLRTYADFENYRKRVSKEKDEVAQAVSERILREVLEVKDHLELALSHGKDKEGSPELVSLRQGVELTLRQLQSFLSKSGVEEVKAQGEKFDPAIHEAIQQDETAEVAPGAVSRVFQKGYRMNGRLLRPARVSVAKEAMGRA
jgi:molecular chaperone GrpE